MKITALEVDGFGVWSGLKLGGLSDGLNVFYGPNEAGKTTLMQFVRSVFYGFSPERRRYLPAPGAVQAGGTLHLASASGRCALSRRPNPAQPDGPELVTLLAPDGTRQGEAGLRALLSGVDEKTFNNVFAVGLGELQQLATLTDTQAATLLYQLTSGLDRVSLVEVMRDLEGSRNRILDAGGGPCQLGQLLAQRDRLRLQIDEAGSLGRRHARLAAEHRAVQQELARLQKESHDLQQQIRLLEVAAGLRDRWQRRAAVRAELAALEPCPPVPEGLAERLAAVSARLDSYQKRHAAWKQHWEQLRAEAAGLEINEALLRLAPRIEGLQEQEGWLGTLENRVIELELETNDLEAQLAGLRKRFGLAEDHAGALAAVPARAVPALREPARLVRRCGARLAEAQREAAAAQQTADALSAQIQAVLDAQGETELAAAMDRGGNLVALLRRRAQIDERLEKMDRYRAELEEQSQHLLDRQLTPLGTILALGGIFAVGVILAMAGLFLPKSITGALGWPMAILGLGGTVAAVIARVVLERSSARQLEACQKQIEVLAAQTKQAKQEREQLQQQLPGPSGSIAGRLKAAEEALAALEALAPLDAQRQAALEQAQSASRRIAQAQSELEAARRRWREAVGAAGLPKSLSPKRVRQLAASSERITEIQRALAARREELNERRRELAALAGRIRQLAAEAGLPVATDNPAELLRELARQSNDQQGRLKRRRVVRRQARKLRRSRTRLQAALRDARRRKHELLRSAGAADEEELRRRIGQAARIASLRRELEAVEREITAATAMSAPEPTVRQLLEEVGDAGPEARRAELAQRLHAIAAQVHQRLEHRGRLAEQLKALAEDRGLLVQQLELGVLEKRIEQAVEQWQLLAVTRRLLETVRTRYERERQPETLQEASGYFSRMTLGRYQRVWTPLAEESLLVDTADGRTLSVELLSQGGREQLFLCLRLALASGYARRGADLPLILDDVLVNFDSERAKAAAALLCEYGQTGRQVLLFTCHEHLARLFGSLRVEVRSLPGCGGFDVDGAAPLPSPRRPRKRRPPPDPRPHRLIAQSTTREEPAEPELPPDPEDAAETPAAPSALAHLAPWEEDDEGAVDPLLGADEQGAEAA